MNKYMLTIQHDQQKVAYIEFTAENNNQAKIRGNAIFEQYKNEPVFRPTAWGVITGNFSGHKPRITDRYISVWVKSPTACNAWGAPSGGYWKGIK